MIYVLSDIHGNARRFNSILSQIRLGEADTLYILGDVIDRHGKGIAILRQIMAAPNMKMLLGNHEYMMLRALDIPYDRKDIPSEADREKYLAHWYRNSGEVTHKHLKRLRKALRSEIFAYLRRLPLNIDITVGGKAYKLVHGAPEELYCAGEPRYTSAAYWAVWKRWEDSDPLPGGYTMIFGHTPTEYLQPGKPMTVYYGKGKIGIDCGSGYPEGSQGRLACLRLDDMREFYSEE